MRKSHMSREGSHLPGQVELEPLQGEDDILSSGDPTTRSICGEGSDAESPNSLVPGTSLLHTLYHPDDDDAASVGALSRLSRGENGYSTRSTIHLDQVEAELSGRDSPTLTTM